MDIQAIIVICLAGLALAGMVVSALRNERRERRQHEIELAERTTDQRREERLREVARSASEEAVARAEGSRLEQARIVEQGRQDLIELGRLRGASAPRSSFLKFGSHVADRS